MGSSFSGIWLSTNLNHAFERTEYTRVRVGLPHLNGLAHTGEWVSHICMVKIRDQPYFRTLKSASLH